MTKQVKDTQTVDSLAPMEEDSNVELNIRVLHGTMTEIVDTNKRIIALLNELATIHGIS